MKLIVTFLFNTILLMSLQLNAQSTIEDFVRIGIEHHDKGEYSEAIEIYKKAYEIDPDSPLVNYELGMSYFSNKNYEKAIIHTDAVISSGTEFVLQAYVIKGSVLDVMGKTKESIALFEKAIVETNGHYLLNYNLALNYYNLGELEKAETQVIKAIEQNISHSSSHVMLANIHSRLGNRIQSLLASYYFLFIEPDTDRSIDTYDLLNKNYNSNVSYKEDGSGDVNIELAMDDDRFNRVELMISLQSAGNLTPEKQEQTDFEKFSANSDALFSQVEVIMEGDHEDIWAIFYASFFSELWESEHVETFCRYISQGVIESSGVWLEANEDKLIAFDNWLQGE